MSSNYNWISQDKVVLTYIIHYVYAPCGVVPHVLLGYRACIRLGLDFMMILWEKEKLFPTVVPPFVVRSSEHLGHFVLLVLLHGFGRFARSCSGCNGALGSIVGVSPGTLSYYLTTPCDDSRMEGLAKICTPDHVEETIYFFLLCAFGSAIVELGTIFFCCFC